MPHPDAPSMEDAVTRVVAFFEHITPANLAAIDRIYAPDARFKDPFNEVCGVQPIQQIFEHMYVALDQPRFVVTGRVVQGQQCFLTWDFLFAFKNYHRGETQTVRGASHLGVSSFSVQ